MNGSPSVVVNKGGFFSSLARGFFMMIITIVICATIIGVFGMRVVDSKFHYLLDNVGTITAKVVETLPQWQEALPPQIGDALNDRRAPDYREQVDISARMVEVDGDDLVLIEVANKGDEIISMLPLRVVLENDDGVPVREITLYAVAPLQLGDDVPGPLWPDTGTRKITRRLWFGEGDDGPNVTVELTDLRVAVIPPGGEAAGEVEVPELAEAPAESQ
jgi:hypothetical protein